MRQNIIIYILLAVITTGGNTLQAQSINWGSLQKEQKQIVSAHAGWQHGFTYGLGYGYKINERLFPAFISADISAPSGDRITDDFKARAGANIQWLNHRNFRFSTNLHAVFRRYQNDYVRLANFGSDFSGVIGYYRRKWYAATEIGFDKAIVTHFKHSEQYKLQFPGVANGWYEPATGGIFYYGLQAGCSFARHDIWVKAGKTLAEDFKTRPVVPMYGQLGYNLKF